MPSFHEKIRQCIRYPKTDSLDQELPLYNYTYTCDGYQSNLRQFKIQILPNIIEKVVEDIDKNAEWHLVDTLDGFLFLHNDFPIVKYQRSNSNGHGRTGTIDVSCLFEVTRK